MLDVTGFNEYNIKLDSVIGNDTRHTKNRGGGVTNGVLRVRTTKNFAKQSPRSRPSVVPSDCIMAII